MSAAHIQIVKWSFPALALIIGLLWYKRRRVDRADPGGINNPDCNGQELVSNEKEVTKTSLNFCDSGIHIDESFSVSSSCQSTEETVCSPRKRSESLDIPQRKIGSQPASMRSRTPEDEQAWYSYLDSSSHKMDIQLGSNPKTSNFDMVARSRSVSSLENAVDSTGKVLKIFEDVAEEEESTASHEKSTSVIADKCEENNANDQCNYSSSKQPPVATPSKDSVKTQAQALSERDSANHSPVSGVLEGSVTDEARSEGSTDSGKGGSIKGHAKDSTLPMIYEFNIPQHLVGRLIGRNGSFLQSIREKAEVYIIVKRHHTLRDQKICAIEGSTEEINIALDMIRQKFPAKKYPDVTLEQILPLKVLNENAWVAELIQLSLVEGLTNDVVICHIVKPNRFFVQLPTHPTYPSLRLLDENMTLLYNTTESPPIPDELSKGMMFVAKWYNRWVRVYVEQPDPLGERHLVRLVDHGGYWFFSSAEMKKIRSDYLGLPLQAIEVFLANIQPKNGEWTQEAYDVVAHMCSGIVGQAQIEGYIDTCIYVNVYLNIQKHGVISLADELIARGFAEPVPLESIVPEEEVTFT
ncbi:KH domain-containing protein akap-1 [Hylaeus anthracinus]|uniref:KH domain-containing protein akap-1 n=1 Tax=Hylaeus anthracinus TaxID=313031 RepID=UPI0023B99783|nr:KH domain-containing protein akap-1 [Hylaeus anthracinus]XP_053998593.1 KH domain-containing protein akap-1 [Hylaeus anthracinus]XP_053998594.1 KH domain-containing protein akap-1 [Hylaeus anthracinus]XP_053998595.1 KH domain-containing protein akap-1 [Hylaeus anthracinus]